ncbi:hypothetical protein KsCSTR_00840 [Candidatus Kuenenia stuttgartiensis]|nr:hypothetical protein KsCSTR_00840 [Candidatus Kuenenia stuttgartiensis]
MRLHTVSVEFTHYEPVEYIFGGMIVPRLWKLIEIPKYID